MPGNRTYTRKILFAGNNTTQDHVLRREMRQFEGAWTSDKQIENSKVRLERLGYFKEVEVETIPVPLTDDQVDILYTVEEENTGSIGGNIGYSDFGLMLGFNLQEQNFLAQEIQLELVLVKIFIQKVIIFLSKIHMLPKMELAVATIFISEKLIMVNSTLQII